MKTQIETPNFNTETVHINHDGLNNGVTKIFNLSESDRDLWDHLPNVVKTSGLRHIKCQHQVRVVIPPNHKAYSHGSVIRDGKLVFTYSEE